MFTLGSELREQKWDWEEWNKMKIKPTQGCVIELVTAMGYWGSVLPGDLWRAVQNAPQTRSPEGTKDGSLSPIGQSVHY